MDMYMKRQTFSGLNGSDSNVSDVGSSEVLVGKRNRSSFDRKYDAV